MIAILTVAWAVWFLWAVLFSLKLIHLFNQ
jgi:hypothetical protein